MNGGIEVFIYKNQVMLLVLKGSKILYLVNVHFINYWLQIFVHLQIELIVFMIVVVENTVIQNFISVDFEQKKEKIEGSLQEHLNVVVVLSNLED